MTAQKDNPNLTITLTGRAPVKIKKDEWPMLASAEDHRYDGQYDFQAIEHWRSNLYVRQHNDGRTIIYGVYSFQSSRQGKANYDVRGGELITVTGASETACGDTQPIVEAIQRVGRWMAENLPSEHQDDAEVFSRLTNQCIADLPAEEL